MIIKHTFTGCLSVRGGGVGAVAKLSLALPRMAREEAHLPDLAAKYFPNAVG